MKFLNRLSIVKKIGLGYSLVIGVSVLGTSIGLVNGHLYQKKAEEQLNIADRQQHPILQLENAVTKVRLHRQRLVAVWGDSIWFEYESNRFLTGVKLVQKILDELEDFREVNSENLAVGAADLSNLLKSYKNNTEADSDLIKNLW